MWLDRRPLMKHSEAYMKILPYLERMRRLRHTASIIYYDLACVAGKDSIKDESELLNHWLAESAKISQDKDFIAAVKEGKKDKDASVMEKRLFENLYKDIEFMEKFTMEEYLEYRNTISDCNEQWRICRPKNDFKGWLPYWKKQVESSRKVARKMMKEGQTPYDTCLDSYEPGNNEAFIDSIFNPLKDTLIPLLKKAKEKQKSYAIPALKSYDKIKQKEMSLRMLKAIHYDMDKGALMESAHPFSDAFAKNDARVTTKFLPEDWRSNVFTCLHEGGHALEFQNWTDEMFENHVENMATSAICETHSRFFENIIGRSKAFMPILQKDAAETLDPELGKIASEDFYHLMNQIQPWLIRCEADELSYCLHIIIRYEIEKDLINGKIECEDVPAIWKQKYHNYLGVEVTDDKDGCMQDTHWSEALWGYFPSYALGNLYGAMIKEKIESEMDFEGAIKENHIDKIVKWMREKDYCYDYLKPNDWIMKVVGKPLSAEPYIKYLKEKFE